MIYANKATVRALIRYGLVKIKNSHVRLTGLGVNVIYRYFASKGLIPSRNFG